jgi:phosphatidylserine/phosphatidylglycerophosphate/cardiolipin synthase-like enzyme
MYHTKAAVFNSQWALVGSNNFGPKSDFSDEEFLISICDQRVAAAFQRNLAVERNLSLPISAEDALRWQGCAGIPGRFQHYLTSRFGG